MADRFKDHFSEASDKYGRYRPNYPARLFSWLASIAPHRSLAWDCATGNGQAAILLSEHFDRIVATDASRSQIGNATTRENISYRIALAENSGLAPDSVDLIAVAQAFHWLDREAFSREVDGVLKENGVLAIWTYNLLSVSPDVDSIIQHLYSRTLGKYWAFERTMVENGYADVWLPFEKISTPEFHMSMKWSLPQLIGYLGTWSATRKYQQETGTDPVQAIREELGKAWGHTDGTLPIRWPLSVRAWRKTAH